MKKILFTSIVLYYFFSQISCGKLFCRREFYFKNNSNDSIIMASRGNGPFGGCNLWFDGGFSPGEGRSEDYMMGGNCINDRLSDGNTVVFYIVDPQSYDDYIYDYYSCDSIEIKNKILKKYELSLTDFKDHDFTISYP